MLNRSLIPILIVTAALAASGQVSIEEAQRKLNQKLATHPASTQPLSDVDRLRQENRRLREENIDLTREVAQLRDALAVAAGTPSTNPTTAPALAGTAGQMIGRWQGGSLLAGNAFIITFVADGTYTQSWLTATHRETGNWQISGNDVVEMWTTHVADDPKRNHWHVSFTKDQMTLSPLDTDGTPLAGAKPFILEHPH
jgi:hypothetical protein